MSKKVALFAFQGDVVCFAHVLLNALDLHEKGYEVAVVLEGPSTKTAVELGEGEKPFSALYKKAKAAGLIDCACKACAAKVGALEGIKAQEITLDGEMSGHPAMSRYLEAGYKIITF